MTPSHIQSLISWHVFYLNISLVSLSPSPLPYIPSHHGQWQPQEWAFCLQLDPPTAYSLLLLFEWCVRKWKSDIRFPTQILWCLPIALWIQYKLCDLVGKTLWGMNLPLHFLITGLALPVLFSNSISSKRNSFSSLNTPCGLSLISLYACSSLCLEHYCFSLIACFSQEPSSRLDLMSLFD